VRLPSPLRKFVGRLIGMAMVEKKKEHVIRFRGDAGLTNRESSHRQCCVESSLTGGGIEGPRNWGFWSTGDEKFERHRILGGSH